MWVSSVVMLACHVRTNENEHETVRLETSLQYLENLSHC